MTDEEEIEKGFEDYELTLFDRIEVIKKTIIKYGEENFYISFSGGKDSTVLSHLVDMALPGNIIPRVFINTGIEYFDIVNFVKSLASEDDRFVIISSHKPIKKVLEENGYPFKSKEHSQIVAVYQNSGIGKSVRCYLGEEGYKQRTCPKILRYQFEEGFKLRVSDKCCLNLKKKPFAKWKADNGKSIVMTGMRKSEGGLRASIKGCILTDDKGNLVKFHPLLVVSDEFEQWLIERERIKLCKLYYPPYNFKRTGCKGCPFSLDLQEQLTLMEIYMPNERAQCEQIWKPVYEEYRRIGFRLDKCEQFKLF